MRPSRKGRFALVVAMLALFALEMYGVFTDADTISGLTADVFRTNTALGRGIFTVAWIAFAGWFGWHIWFWGRSAKNPDRRPDQVESDRQAAPRSGNS